MPNEPTCASDSDQPVKVLPDRPLSKTQYYRRKKLARELGVSMDQIPDRRGRHANHARGGSHYRWNAESRMISEHGYIKLRVGVHHPLADPNGYAYEHLIVWAAAGRPLPGPDEVIHHGDEDKSNNRIDNLELKTRSNHNMHHNEDRERDWQGRFLPASQE